MKLSLTLLTFLLAVLCPIVSFSQTTSQEKKFKDYTETLYEIRFTDGDSAKQILQKQKRLAKETGSNTYIAQNLVNYYHCYWVLQPNPYDSACAYLKKGIDYAKKADDHLLLCDMYGQLGQEYLISGEFDKASKVADKAIFYGKKANVLPQLNNAYYMKSASEKEIGNLQEALRNALEGVKVWDKMEDHSKSNFNPAAILARIYEDQGEYEKAVDCLEKVIARNEKDNVMINVIGAKLPLASVLEKMGDISGAKRTYKECVEIGEELGNIEATASAYVRLANIYLFKGDINLDSTKYYLDKYDSILPRVQSPISVFRFNTGYGDYLIELGNFSEAKKRYMESYNLYKSLGGGYPQDDMMILTEKLAKVCDTMNQPAEALKFYREFVGLKEAALDKEKIEELKEIEMNFGFEKKELAALADKKETELVYQKNLASEQRGKYMLIFGLCLAALIAGGIWYALQKRKKQAVILNDKNAQIQENLEEKQLLLKEIHHRVKNNFQIVSSLLEMQTRGIEDEQALELAKEGQNRIKSMAIIHQKLYQNDDLLIEFEDYVQRLVGEIQNTFASKQMNAKIEVQSELVLDIDTAIPLGLVLNELITNAFKYGFDSEKEENNLLIKIEKGLDNYSMIVADTGDGISDEVDLKTTKSIGLYLVRRLSKQLGGSMEYSYQNGSKFEVSFKDTNMRMA